MTWLWVLIAILANYRLARMLATEDGPFDAFSRFQEWAGGSKTWVGRGLACPFCVGYWTALPLALIVISLLPMSPDWRMVVLLWLAISGGQTIIQKVVG